MEFLWNEIPGLEGFEASTSGHIRNAKTLKQLKEHTNNTGYRLVYCHGYGMYTVHRLVCITYNPNPNNLQQVNHINGVKTDNRPENLEWMSLGDNVRDFWNNPIFTEKQKRVKRQVSERMSSRIWITDGEVNYRIQPERISEFPNFHSGQTRHKKEASA